MVQHHVLVKKGWTYKELRRETLFPLDMQLILETLKIIKNGQVFYTASEREHCNMGPPIEQNIRHRGQERIMLWANLKSKTLALYAIFRHFLLAGKSAFLFGRAAL